VPTLNVITNFSIGAYPKRLEVALTVGPAPRQAVPRDGLKLDRADDARLFIARAVRDPRTPGFPLEEVAFADVLAQQERAGQRALERLKIDLIKLEQLFVQFLVHHSSDRVP
jgi:hypothetical protein